MSIDKRLSQNIAIKGFESANGDGEFFGNLDDSSIEAIKQAILSDLLEIIGEDENSMVEEQYASPQPTIDEHYRNQLRQELREKVKKYCE